MALTRIVLAGTSGTGKSSLLRELQRRGHPVVEEPQRAVLTEQLEVDGPCLPSKSPRAFLDALGIRGVEDWRGAETRERPTFYDRGLPDLVAYAERFGVAEAAFFDLARAHPYDQVFVLGPWRAIFEADVFRGLSFEAYRAFHDRILDAYARLGYAPTELPRASVERRADLVDAWLSAHG